MEYMWFVALVALLVCYHRAAGVTVTTPVGDIEGFEETINVHGREESVRKFLGIPYAEPPTGSRRFAKPVPKGRFSAPHQAMYYGTSCYQIPSAESVMSEDCLFLNIFSPVRPTGSETFPVMIWIHGGGFVIGSSLTYPGEYFSATGQVILVTINYRLAELGFLSTMDSAIPGNFGLWDQHLAIKWVHDNIGAFGGDTSRVTIFGESAGSASVVYQTLYPGNMGLFQRAICQSGSATAAWARTTATVAKDGAEKFAKAIGCYSSNSVDTIQCLRTKSATEINATMNGDNDVPKRWAPVVDNDFVLDLPEKIIDYTSKATSASSMFGSVDLIIGVNNLDGAIQTEVWMQLLNKTDIVNFTLTNTEFKNVLIPFYFPGMELVTDIISLEYTDWSDPRDDSKRLRKLADLATDMFFKVPALDVADSHRWILGKITYVYEFAVPMFPSHLFDVPKVLDGPGLANHADDLAYLFRGADPTDSEAAASSANLDTSQMSTTLRVSTAMITMWTNFAKSGNPNKPVDVSSITNVIWPIYGIDQNYLEITASMTSQSVHQRLAPRAVDFFKKVLPGVMKAAQCKPCPTPSHSGILFG